MGSLIFITHTLYNFFASEWSHFNLDYYMPTIIFFKKAIIIIFILMLILKWTKLLVISKRYIYLYIYYVIIAYSSGVLGELFNMFFARKLVEMGLL